jgi:anti-anti-sigma regulatory factor
VSTVSLDAVEALARLQLAARRKGLDLRLHVVSRELRDLIELAGLTDVLRVEPRRQAEEREQRLGVEEEGELGDAVV